MFKTFTLAEFVLFSAHFEKYKLFLFSLHIGVLWHIAENNLNYTFSFDRTGKSNTSIESVKGLLLFVYTHNKKTLGIYKIKKTNRVRCLQPWSAWSSFRNAMNCNSANTQLRDMREISIESLTCLLLNWASLIENKYSVIKAD